MCNNIPLMSTSLLSPTKTKHTTASPRSALNHAGASKLIFVFQTRDQSYNLAVKMELSKDFPCPTYALTKANPIAKFDFNLDGIRSMRWRAIWRMVLAKVYRKQTNEDIRHPHRSRVARLCRELVLSRRLRDNISIYLRGMRRLSNGRVSGSNDAKFLK